MPKRSRNSSMTSRSGAFRRAIGHVGDFDMRHGRFSLFLLISSRTKPLGRCPGHPRPCGDTIARMPIAATRAAMTSLRVPDAVPHAQRDALLIRDLTNGGVWYGPAIMRSGFALARPGHGAHPRFSSLKKSLPLSSITMKAGKSSTSMRQIASMPSSGYSTVSTFLMQCSARFAAAPPIEAR